MSVSARSGGKTFDKNYNLGIGRGVDKVAGLIFIDLCRLFKLHPLRTLYSSKTTIKQVFDIANNHISEFSNNFRLDVVSMDTSDDTKVKVRFNICNKGTNSILGTRTFVIDFNYKNFDYSKSTSANTRTLAFLSSKGELEELSELLVCCYVSNGGSSFTDDYGSGADLNCSVSDVASSLYMSMEKILGNNLKYTKYIC